MQPQRLSGNEGSDDGDTYEEFASGRRARSGDQQVT